MAQESIHAKKFSQKEAVLFGWETFKKHAKFLLGVYVVAGLINLINPSGFALGTQATTNSTAPYFGNFLYTINPYIRLDLLSIIWSLLEAVVFMGLVKIALDLHDKKPVKFSDLFMSYPLLLKYVVANILYSFAVTIGIVLLIVPGVILALRLQYFSYLIVDKNFGIIESLQESWNMTRGATWNLFLLWLLLVGILLVGVMVFVVGLLVAVPVIMLANTWIYRKLSA